MQMNKNRKRPRKTRLMESTRECVYLQYIFAYGCDVLFVLSSKHGYEKCISGGGGSRGRGGGKLWATACLPSGGMTVETHTRIL